MDRPLLPLSAKSNYSMMKKTSFIHADKNDLPVKIDNNLHRKRKRDIWQRANFKRSVTQHVQCTFALCSHTNLYNAMFTCTCAALSKTSMNATIRYTRQKIHKPHVVSFICISGGLPRGSLYRPAIDVIQVFF